MTKRAPPNWERARDDYAHCPDPLPVIAERNGMSRTALWTRAKAESWKREVKTVPRQRRSKEELAAIAVETSRRELGTSIAGRLYRTIDRKLQEIEKRMSEQAEGAAPQSAADMERDARSLNSLARLYAKLVELDEAAKPPASKDGQGSDTDAATRSDDADQLRRDLALRLERLNRERDA